MNYSEKLDYIRENHFAEWLKMRKETDEEVSNEHEVFCVCGRLCTGFHMQTCRRFIDAVNRRTLKKMKSLLEGADLKEKPHHE